MLRGGAGRPQWQRELLDGVTSVQQYWYIKIPLMIPAFTISLFLTLRNSFMMYDANQRANAIWKKRLAEYEMPPMDDAIAEELNEFVDRRKQELPDEFA